MPSIYVEQLHIENLWLFTKTLIIRAKVDCDLQKDKW